jgi:DNA repair photolyase
MVVPLLSVFDPWKNPLCTCPQKLTVNPYTGCNHGCLYCYASSYVPNFADVRPKKDLPQALAKETIKLRGQTVTLCSSSDPYPPMEASVGQTRKCLDILARSNCRLEIVTKSNLVVRDDDLFKKVPTTVAFTITTDNEALAKELEPNAPSPSERISAAQDLLSQGIPVLVRIDPIIPFLNDQPRRLIALLAAIGVKHITSSTYKPKPDNWRRLSQAYPQVAEKLKPLYFQEGERVGGNTYLPKDLRFKLLKEVHDVVVAHGLQFGVCREGLPALNTAACDGSWLFGTWKGEPQRPNKLLES